MSRPFSLYFSYSQGTDNNGFVVAAQNFCQNFSKLLTKLFGKYFRYL